MNAGSVSQPWATAADDREALSMSPDLDTRE